MAKPLKQINQEIAVLEEKVTQLAGELRKIYAQYIELLGQGVKRQLVLASYQICTQTYPERFLKLSVQERQELQQVLRQLGRQTKKRLLSFLQSSSESREFEEDQDQEEEELLLFNNPRQILAWQNQLEENISETLQVVSKEINLLLYENGIFSRKLPEKVLETAVDSEESEAPSSGPPNILNLLVEVETEQSRRDRDNLPTPISAVRLRLSEIEFVEPALHKERDRLRTLIAELKQIGKKYQKIQRDKAIAEAESAWRSNWYEDLDD